RFGWRRESKAKKAKGGKWPGAAHRHPPRKQSLIDVRRNVHPRFLPQARPQHQHPVALFYELVQITSPAGRRVTLTDLLGHIGSGDHFRSSGKSDRATTFGRQGNPKADVCQKPAPDKPPWPSRSVKV